MIEHAAYPQHHFRVRRLGIVAVSGVRHLGWKRRVDFGRCTVDSGTFRFKRQWGAEQTQLYWHYWLRDGQDVPQLNPDNPKYRLLVKLWQRQPLALANLIGPHIVRNLP